MASSKHQQNFVMGGVHVTPSGLPDEIMQKWILDILEKESEKTIKWFKQNEMIVNPDKFESMAQGRHKQKETINLKISGAEIKGQNSVTLLGVYIDNQLNFDNHISNSCKRAGNEINAIS